jgi:hypothetical protein
MTNIAIKEQGLFEYGIRTERSDIRAHVCVIAQRVLAFQTKEMIRLLEERKYVIGEATQPGAHSITGRGFLVPIDDIIDLRVLNPVRYNWRLFPDRTASTSEKGSAAVEAVAYTMRNGRFPIWFERPDEEASEEIQIEGTDIILFATRRVQVKCDYFAGKREWDPRCTGNLFIQTAERNPFKRI